MGAPDGSDALMARSRLAKKGSDDSGSGDYEDEAPIGESVEPASTAQGLAHSAGRLAGESGSD